MNVKQYYTLFRTFIAVFVFNIWSVDPLPVNVLARRRTLPVWDFYRERRSSESPVRKLLENLKELFPDKTSLHNNSEDLQVSGALKIKTKYLKIYNKENKNSDRRQRACASVDCTSDSTTTKTVVKTQLFQVLGEKKLCRIKWTKIVGDLQVKETVGTEDAVQQRPRLSGPKETHKNWWVT